VLDLPFRLPAEASTVTTAWALVNAGLVVSVAFWATGVQHRRRSHRFPVSLEAAWAPDDGGLPSLAGHIDDLSRHGARLIADEARRPGERVRLVMLLDDGPIEVTGEVATVRRLRRDGRHRIGVAFDPLPPSLADAIVAWCFRHPFGTPLPGVPAPHPAPAPAPARRPAPAAAHTLLAAAETASTAEPPADDRSAPAEG
jgi:hypothetical protein